MATVTLPFYASDIPCSLPTETEIDDAPDICESYTARRVVQVGEHFVVKYGRGVDLIEGENMRYVREHTKIPIPRVYALYSSPTDGKNYIVMERIIGQSLLSAWPELTFSEKEIITRKLRDYFDELRQLSSPPEYGDHFYGSIGRRHLLDGVFWTKDPDPMINGPFNSEEALNEAMALKYIHEGGPRYRAEFYRCCFPHIMRGHKPTFTHGDFQRKNIMIYKGAGKPDSESDSETDSTSGREWQPVILDWEKSGWYPSYWEYAGALLGLRYDDDWCLWIDKVLEPFVAEAAWMNKLYLELWS